MNNSRQQRVWDVIEIAFWSITATILCVCIWALINEPMSKDVYISNMTGECVKVISYDSGEPTVEICDDLPKQYNLIRVY